MSGSKESGINAAARTLNVTIDSIYRLIWAGRLEAKKNPEGKWMVQRAAIERRLKERRRKSAR